jgi:chemotaxis protein methyltransferase CheR
MKQCENAIPLSDEIFRQLRDLLYESCGVYYDDGSKFIFEARMQNSLQRRQFDNFQDYYYFLKYDREKDKELESLIDILTVHETYFFREDRQLRAFSEEILPQILADPKMRQRKQLRIWSAGCSTGEEAYTLSMLILENDGFKDWKIDILASDISHSVLQAARRGYYQGASFRSIEPYYLSKYFQKEGNGRKVLDVVKHYVTFLHLNLARPEKWAFMNNMDIVFCRNVIIYFTMEVKKKVIAGFYKSLSEGGYLMLGHSESLINISTDYALCHLKSDIVYRKLSRESSAA